MTKVYPFVALGLALALAGCGAQTHQGPYGGHNAHWYATHSKQAVAEVKWCDAGSTHRENTQTCNAAYAGIQDAVGYG